MGWGWGGVRWGGVVSFFLVFVLSSFLSCSLSLCLSFFVLSFLSLSLSLSLQNSGFYDVFAESRMVCGWFLVTTASRCRVMCERTFVLLLAFCVDFLFLFTDSMLFLRSRGWFADGFW